MPHIKYQTMLPKKNSKFSHPSVVIASQGLVGGKSCSPCSVAWLGQSRNPYSQGQASSVELRGGWRKNDDEKMIIFELSVKLSQPVYRFWFCFDGALVFHTQLAKIYPVTM